MKIGIDISALQGAHRMRGIGFTVLNFINGISEDARKQHSFVLFVLPSSVANSPIDLLNLSGMDYEIRDIELTPDRPVEHSSFVISARLRRLINSVVKQGRELRSRYVGSSNYPNLDGIDVFLQPDTSQALPRKRGMKKVLIIYDIIPYVLEWEYLWSYGTARIHGFSRKSAYRCSVRRWLYLKKLKVNVRKANTLIAISEHTKQDFVRFVKVKPAKIHVTHLGVTDVALNGLGVKPNFQRYVETSWGYSPRKYNFSPDTPYLLFVGGADQRRKLNHLVTALNHLRAQGHDIKLVLAGDTMQGPKSIPTLEIQNALLSSSYIDDIVFMGFVSDEIREYLYENALAFVYPSVYEGFGLPILEAMRYGTPVITYRNSSIDEVAENAAIYVDGFDTIMGATKDLLTNEMLRQKYAKLGQKQTEKFSWVRTSENILDVIIATTS